MSNQNHLDIQRKILGILSMRGNITDAQLAKRLRIRPHTVRYYLTKLREVGTIGTAVFIDQRRLGYHVFNLLFDVQLTALPERSVGEN